MALVKRKAPLTELYPEREALRNQPIKKDPRIKDFIDVQKDKQKKLKKIIYKLCKH